MKKTISVLMICTMMLCFTACGKSKEIELTLDNYNDYITVEAVAQPDVQNGEIYQPPGMGWYYDRIEVKYYSTGASSNYNYNDVKIDVKATVNCNGYVWSSFLSSDGEIKPMNFEKQYVIDTNIAGNSDVYTDIIMLDDYIVDRDMVDIEYEIVGVSGTLSPVE